MIYDPSADCPTVWFAVLERALRSRDIELAEDAERNLNRLGVTVLFLPSQMLRMQEEEQNFSE